MSKRPLDLDLLRELAAELGYWPGSTEPQDVARYREQIAAQRTAAARTFTPADGALRERITELSVHISCGDIRGPLQRSNPYHRRFPIRWQSCHCEDNPETWSNCDVPREKDFCIVCLRATAGGTSRWSWLACEHCRAVNDAIGLRAGGRPFALGRHSIMNGISVRGGQSSEVTTAQILKLVAFARGDTRLTDWRQAEYRRLAAVFDPESDVPLREWQQQWPPGNETSVEAFSRLLDGKAIAAP